MAKMLSGVLFFPHLYFVCAEVVLLVIRDGKNKILPTHLIQPSNSCPVWAFSTLKEDMTPF